VLKTLGLSLRKPKIQHIEITALKRSPEIAAYPTNATLDKDTGLQGYEPEGALTQQPQKSPQARS
jgi:hypothetical protein